MHRPPARKAESPGREPGALVPSTRSSSRAARAERRLASRANLAPTADALLDGDDPVANAAPYQDEEQRDVEDREDSRGDHSADHGCPDRDSAVRAGAGRDRQW